jgi:hypothetical protein
MYVEYEFVSKYAQCALTSDGQYMCVNTYIRILNICMYIEYMYLCIRVYIHTYVCCAQCALTSDGQYLYVCIYLY